MKETSPQAGDHDADHGPRVTGRKSEPDVTQGVYGQSGRQEPFAAQAVGHHSHAVAGQKVCEHHQSEQESGLLDAGELQVPLDQQIERHERDVIDMRERVQRAAKPKRANFVILNSVHCHN